MNDTISRQAAIDAINSYFGFNIEEEYGSAVQEVINGLPSAQPERKSGRWIEYIPEHGKCPFCGNQVDLLNGKANNFCGECGADMREGKE